MKYLLLSALFSIPTLAFGSTTPAVSLYEQLVGLNKYWINNSHVVLPSTGNAFLSEIELIQTHLQLVEQELRSRETNHLNDAQKHKRTTTLDILHQYWQKGIFPQNIYHSSRTPYFIDHLGTACAVGQLIIETGNEEIAKKISIENNYAFIENMNFPELISWAYESGFTVEELKWIQPSYCYNECHSDSIQHVSCHGGWDGCVGISWGDLPGGAGSVYIFDGVYRFNEEANEWYHLWSGCDLSAGYYKLVWIDEYAIDYNIFFDILEPEPITLESRIKPAVTGCSGSIQLNVSGGVGPYTYSWSNGKVNPVIYGLCPGKYWVNIKDANGCVKYHEFNVSLESSTSELPKSSLKFFPNPVGNILNMNFESASQANIEIKIFNTQGGEVYSNITSFTMKEIDISNLPDGVYVLFLSSGDEYLQEKVVKVTR